jgi:hypothetical protein
MDISPGDLSRPMKYSVMNISNAPGCFGSPTIRARNHPLCGQCNFARLCKAEAADLSARLDEVKRDLRVKTKPKPPIEGLTEQGRKLVDALSQQNVDLAAVQLVLSAPNKIAPKLTQNWEDPHVCWGVDYLRRHRQASYGELINEFRRRSATAEEGKTMPDGSVSLHVTSFLDAMKYLGVVAEDDGYIKVIE